MPDDAADAARYRYLKGFAQGNAPTMKGCLEWTLRLPPWALVRARSLDASIDRAIQQESQQTPTEGAPHA
jgi:hypothetical protein